MSVDSVQHWDAMMSCASKMRSVKNPDAADMLHHAAAVQLKKLLDSPPLPLAFWEELLLEKQVSHFLVQHMIKHSSRVHMSGCISWHLL